jgi:hypothetical protein
LGEAVERVRGGGRRRSEAGVRIPPVGGRYRKVAVTTHRFGLWAVLAAGRECVAAHAKVERREGDLPGLIRR